MTDEARLAAALRTQLHDAISGWFGCEHEGPQGEWPCEDFFARLMGSPTLKAAICPDPADHALAAAVRGLDEQYAEVHLVRGRDGRWWQWDREALAWVDAGIKWTAALEDKP